MDTADHRAVFARKGLGMMSNTNRVPSSGAHSTVAGADEAIPLLLALYPARWSPAALAVAAQLATPHTLVEWRRGLDDIDAALDRALDGTALHAPN